MENRSEKPGSGQGRSLGLAAFLCDLVPESRSRIAWTVAEVFRSVPWTAAARPAGEPDLASFGLTALDAKIGLEAVDWCCSPYRLVGACLHVQLSESQKASPQSRAALRRHCGRLLADGLTDDVGGLRDPLLILIDEHLENEILDDLMTHTELGDRFRLVTARDVHGIEYSVPEPVPGNRVSGAVTGQEGLIRHIDMWDLPAYFLERVPETAYYFARHFADALQDAADTLELESWSGRAGGPAPDLNEAIAGRKLAELAVPGSLVWRLLAPVVSRATLGSAESADLIRRSCEFLDAAIVADTEAGGQLAQELTHRLSDTFIRYAAEIYDASDGALWRILKERFPR